MNALVQLINLGMGLSIFIGTVLLISVNKSFIASYLVLVMLAFAILFLACQKLEVFRSLTTNARDSLWFVLAMFSGLAATMLNQLHYGSISVEDFKSPVMFLLAAPIYMALKENDIRVSAWLQYAFPLGAIIALTSALIILLEFPASGYVNPDAGICPSDLYCPTDSMRFTNSSWQPVHFGNMMLMFGMLSLCSINWIKPDSKFMLILKITGLFAGLCASFMSGARGGWLLIPIIAILWFSSSRKNLPKKSVVKFSVVLALAFTTAYFCVAPIHERVNDSFHEFSLLENGNLGTSLGTRFQIWEAAIYTFIHNPIFGGGSDGFHTTLNAFGNASTISQYAVSEGMQDIHNTFFASIAHLGIFGMAFYFLVHVVPLRTFYAAMKSPNNAIKKSGLMGMCLVIGFLIFGLTVEMDNVYKLAGFYALMVAAFMARINHQPRLAKNP